MICLWKVHSWLGQMFHTGRLGSSLTDLFVSVKLHRAPPTFAAQPSLKKVELWTAAQPKSEQSNLASP